MSGAATDLEYCLNVIILIYCYIKKQGGIRNFALESIFSRVLGIHIPNEIK